MRLQKLLFLGWGALVSVLLAEHKLYAYQLNEGMPYIHNFTPEESNGGIQNWQTVQADNGIIYVANQKGVLEYDGVNWRTITVPNTSVLSVGMQHDTLFVGGTNEIGYLGKPDSDTTYYPAYHSLTDLIAPGYRNFGSVWQVLKVNNGVYFRTPHHLFRYQNGVFKIWESKSDFHFAFVINDQLYINIIEEGLHRLEGDELVLVNKGEEFARDGIYSMWPYKGETMLMATRYKNLILFDGESIRPFKSAANAFLQEKRLYNGLQLKDGSFVFGTLLGGLVHINRKGEVLNIINKKNGLVSDVVYHLFQDQQGNIWSSQNQGISLIQLQSPVSMFDERQGLNGMPLSMIQNEAGWYVGTEKGLFVHKNTDGINRFEQAVANFDRSPRELISYKKGSLLAASNGLWYLKGKQVEKKIDLDYVRCLTASDFSDHIIYLGTQAGVYVVKVEGDAFSLLGKIEGIDAEITSIKEDNNGVVWAGSPSDGLYQITWPVGSLKSMLNPTVKKWAYFTERAKVFDIHNSVFFGFTDSFKRYDAANDTLVRVTAFRDSLDNVIEVGGLFLAAEDPSGTLWMRGDEKYWKLTPKEDDAYSPESGPLNLINSEQHNFIYPDKQGTVWFGVADGLLRYDPKKKIDYKTRYHTFIREVLVRNDSLIHAGPLSSTKSKASHILNYADNELRFKYAAATYMHNKKTRYQVWLQGFDKDWSSWTTETQKDYTNIPEGEYIFHVRAQNIFGEVSKADVFSFSVLPPWYRTIWAYLAYVLLIGSLAYSAYRFRVNNILHEQQVRNRIANDLHDEVSATLSSISYFAQAIQQSPQNGRGERFVGLISESANEAKEKITDIIWSINPENDDWVNLLSKCRRFASDLLESKDISYELNIDESINKPLDLQLRQHFWLIFKEMVTNAVRHSAAGQVDIRLTHHGGILTLVVQDNGTGFDAKKDRLGNGISNIKSRAQDIGGDVVLESDQQLGTRWVLKVKI